MIGALDALPTRVAVPPRRWFGHVRLLSLLRLVRESTHDTVLTDVLRSKKKVAVQKFSADVDWSFDSSETVLQAHRPSFRLLFYYSHALKSREILREILNELEMVQIDCILLSHRVFMLLHVSSELLGVQEVVGSNPASPI